MRKCWNWQTGKTKDLVSVTTCGFKSHLPHEFRGLRNVEKSTFLGFLFVEMGSNLGVP